MGLTYNKRGLLDWAAQRITSLIIGFYAVFLLVYVINNHPMYFAQWQNLFGNTAMKIATVITIASILWHAWIGLWTVFTDYIHSKTVRIIAELIVLLLLVGYLVWLIEILWG